MSNKDKRHEQAFPHDLRHDGYAPGLTKREYFAGLAIQGFLANSVCEATIEKLAKLSVETADALIKELEK